MALWDNFTGKAAAPARVEPKFVAPKASYQDSGGGVTISTPQQLEEAIRGGAMSGAGVAITPHSAMAVAAVYASVRIISGAVANMPLDIKRRVDDRTREEASDHPLWTLIRRKPNRWQTPSQFRRMQTAHVILRGNGYALKVTSRGQVIELIPLNPRQVETTQNDDLTLSYIYTRKDGRRVKVEQADMMHLVGLTLDGVTGVSPITYARESLGSSLAMESHGASTFKNGARFANVMRHPEKLGPEGLAFLKASLAEYRAGGESEGKTLVLEEGMDISNLSMTAVDAQWIEARKFSRTDIAMFMGVPPSMLGDNSGSDSNWGTGLEQKSLGFVTYTLEDYLTMWEETIFRDLVPASETDIYARFNRAALVRGDIKTRTAAQVAMVQWGINNVNEIRALNDENPREGGDVYYDPPNTAGNADPAEGDGDEPKKPA